MVRFYTIRSASLPGASKGVSPSHSECTSCKARVVATPMKMPGFSPATIEVEAPDFSQGSGRCSGAREGTTHYKPALATVRCLSEAPFNYRPISRLHSQFHPHPPQKIFTLSGNLFPPHLVYTGKTTRGVGG